MIEEFIQDFSLIFPDHRHLLPWDLTGNLKELLSASIAALGADYEVENGVARHKTAIIERGVVLKGPIIIGKDCFVGAHAYLRDGVYLDSSVKVGPGCEIKNSIICSGSAMAHFNFIGDSIVGHHTNFEAGAIAANHYNERTIKTISVVYRSKTLDTGSEKFGALVGDHAKIGANAVLSPGTLLEKNAVVRRLELVEQSAPAH